MADLNILTYINSTSRKSNRKLHVSQAFVTMFVKPFVTQISFRSRLSLAQTARRDRTAMSYDAVVIGGGSGGSAFAKRAAGGSAPPVATSHRGDLTGGHGSPVGVGTA